MIKTLFKIFFRLAVLVGVALAVFGVVQYLNCKKEDYVEVFNDDDENMDEEYF
jgi:hypothetical protein